ncbi:hypothetical protein [Kozakia baliensis]|uniref:hypothetical protein n=1 Tax=Kozakia baliensis TaxID=153496 RepID=UPI00049595B4|nr:hypothetical protein [Kozakia baliensis]
MPLIYIVAVFLFLLWWGKGSIWVTLPLAIFPWCLEWLAFKDQHHFDPSSTLLFLTAISAVAFVSFVLRILRQRRIERTLLGVRFNGVD